MMALSLRQIRRRIRSVESTKKITHAMEIVASTKLKRLEQILGASDRYINGLERILQTVIKDRPGVSHPLLSKRAVINSTLVFLITSDTGLCGSYNTNILETVKNYLNGKSKEKIGFIAVGKYGSQFLKRSGLNVMKEFSIPRIQEVSECITGISNFTQDSFSNGNADEVVFIYTKTLSRSNLVPTIKNLFPIATAATARPVTKSKSPEKGEYLIEPSVNDVLETLVPEYIETEIGHMLKHSLVSEQAARMLAMRQATDNATDAIDSLTLARNKARQAAITKELIEVVSGSKMLQRE